MSNNAVSTPNPSVPATPRIQPIKKNRTASTTQACSLPRSQCALVSVSPLHAALPHCSEQHGDGFIALTQMSPSDTTPFVGPLDPSELAVLQDPSAQHGISTSPNHFDALSVVSEIEDNDAQSSSAASENKRAAKAIAESVALPILDFSKAPPKKSHPRTLCKKFLKDGKCGFNPCRYDHVSFDDFLAQATSPWRVQPTVQAPTPLVTPSVSSSAPTNVVSQPLATVSVPPMNMAPTRTPYSRRAPHFIPSSSNAAPVAPVSNPVLAPPPSNYGDESQADDKQPAPAYRPPYLRNRRDENNWRQSAVIKPSIVAPAVVTQPPTQIRLNFVPDKRLASVLLNKLNVEVLCDDPRPNQVSHPYAAVCRRLVRDQILNLYGPSDKFFDLSGDLFLWRRLKAPEEYHVNVGKPTNDDIVKYSNLQPAGDFCQCLLHECGHIASCEWAISVDTLYYYSPQTIYHICSQLNAGNGGTLVAAFSLFPEPIGSLHNGEFHYSCNLDSSVDVWATGGSRYHHDSMHWITAGFQRFGNKTLMWSPLASLDDYNIYQFVITDDLPHRLHTTSSDPAPRILADSEYWGPTKELGIDGKVVNRWGYSTDFVGYNAYSYGSTVAYYDANSTCVGAYPKALCASLSTWISGRQRNKSTWEQLVAKCRHDITSGGFTVPARFSGDIVVPLCAWVYNRATDGENSILVLNQSSLFRASISFAQNIMPNWMVNQIVHTAVYDSEANKKFVRAGFICSIGLMCVGLVYLKKSKTKEPPKVLMSLFEHLPSLRDMWRSVSDGLVSSSLAIRSLLLSLIRTSPEQAMLRVFKLVKSARATLSSGLKIFCSKITNFFGSSSASSVSSEALVSAVEPIVEAMNVPRAVQPAQPHKLVSLFQRMGDRIFKPIENAVETIGRNQLEFAQRATITAQRVRKWLGDDIVDTSIIIRTVVMAPVMEECLKRMSPYFLFVLPLTESLSVGENPTNMTIRFLKHTFFAIVPFEAGVFLHAVHNLLALIDPSMDVKSTSLPLKYVILAAVFLLVYRYLTRVPIVKSTPPNEWSTAPTLPVFGYVGHTAPVFPSEPVSSLGGPITFPSYENKCPPGPVRKGSTVSVSNDASHIPKPHDGMVVGWCIAGVTPVSYASSPDTDVSAMHNRLCPEVPEVDLVAFARYRAAYLLLVRDLKWQPASFEDWLNRFPPAQQKRLLAAKERLDSEGLSKKRMAVNAFMKVEFLPHAIDDALSVKSTRVIQSFSDEFNVHCGPTFLGYSKALYARHDITTNVCIATGYRSDTHLGPWFASALYGTKMRWTNERDWEYDPTDNLYYCKQRLSWELDTDETARSLLSRARRQVLCCDISSFDASQQLCHGEVEVESFIQNNVPKSIVDAELEQWRNSFGSTRNGVRYRMSGTRKTGSPTTTFGNSCVSLAALSSIAEKHGLRMRILGLGDDTIAVPDDDEVDLRNIDWAKEFLDLGFTAKPVIHNPVMADFCSQRFWPDSKGLRLGPMVGRSLGKSGCTLSRIPKKWQQHIVGVILGFRKDWSAVPILRQLVQSIFENHGKHARLVYDTDHRFHSVYSAEATEDTHLLFNARYGLDKDFTDRIEHAIASRDIPYVFTGDEFVSMWKADKTGVLNL